MGLNLCFFPFPCPFFSTNKSVFSASSPALPVHGFFINGPHAALPLSSLALSTGITASQREDQLFQKCLESY